MRNQLRGCAGTGLLILQKLRRTNLQRRAPVGPRMSSLELGRHSAKQIVASGRSALVNKRAYRAQLRKQIGGSGKKCRHSTICREFDAVKMTCHHESPCSRAFPMKVRLAIAIVVHFRELLWRESWSQLNN